MPWNIIQKRPAFVVVVSIMARRLQDSCRTRKHVCMELVMPPACLGLYSNGCEDLYSGYAFGIKNTFLDITPRHYARRTR